jgi:uncharacterized protein
MEKKLKVLAAADLHGDIEIAKDLSKKAKKNKVDLVVLAGDISGYELENGKILEPFIEQKQRVAFIPGNWDTEQENNTLKYLAKSIQNYYITYKNTGIAGIGNPDWEPIRLEDLQILKKNFERMKPKKRILISHWHAKGTKAEFSGIKGDEHLRQIVEEIQPDILISGHIHEAEGIEDKIGKTRVIQVGRRGTIIKI